jgi:hypothetical protein
VLRRVCCVQSLDDAKLQHLAASDQVAQQIEELRQTAFSVSAQHLMFIN